MNLFNIYLIFLKLTLTIQFVLIILKKHSETSVVFLVSNMLFKISIGLFLMLFFLLNKVSEINSSDKVIIGFAGLILIYDAVFIDLPDVLHIYKIAFSPYTLLQKGIRLELI
jgi:hypothetical protein